MLVIACASKTFTPHYIITDKMSVFQNYCKKLSSYSLPVQLAVKAVPYHKDFLATLGSDRSSEGDEAVLQDMAQFAHSLGEIITILNQFYYQHELDSPPEN